MSAKHTPGPWKAFPREPRAGRIDIIPVVANNGDYTVASVHCYGDNAEHNAALIAEAPALLAALKGMFALMEEGVLVRNISRDGDPDFSMRMIEVVSHLKAAYETMVRADPSLKM